MIIASIQDLTREIFMRIFKTEEGFSELEENDFQCDRCLKIKRIVSNMLGSYDFLKEKQRSVKQVKLDNFL
jgi:hypothetical protein